MLLRCANLRDQFSRFYISSILNVNTAFTNDSEKVEKVIHWPCNVYFNYGIPKTCRICKTINIKITKYDPKVRLVTQLLFFFTLKILFRILQFQLSSYEGVLTAKEPN
jgi:hypothetical protein